MSGNINDTNVERLKKEVNELIEELNTITSKGDNIDDYENTLQKKYKYIVKTSESLFKLILQQRGKTSFMDNLNMMLNNIERIQKSQISQHDASCNVGDKLASQFIPQLKK